MDHAARVRENDINVFDCLALVDVDIGDEGGRTRKTGPAAGDSNCGAVHVHFSVSWKRDEIEINKSRSRDVEGQTYQRG